MADGPSIVLVTDSSACLPVEARSGVVVLPILIHLPGTDVRDDQPGAARAVYAALDDGDEVKTSPPSAFDYMLAIERSGARAAVVVTPAREFTVMHRNATIAAEMAAVPVAVVDSRTAAAGQGLVVEAAAAALEAATSVDGVVAAAERAARSVDLVAKLETLSHVRRSGHVGADVFATGARLGVRPVFRMRGGRVQPLDTPRDVDAALDRIRAEWERTRPSSHARTVAFHAAREDEARVLAAAVGADRVVAFSPGMGVHTGPGVVGLAWQRG